jgi:FixJ family two-component response regulator
LRESPVIAIVDDDESVRVSVASLLRSLGYDARSFCSAEEFLGSGSRAEASCVIADMRMPGIGGLGLLRALRAQPVGPPVILITAFADAALRRSAVVDGACCLLGKPFAEGEMIRCLDAAVAARDKAAQAVPKPG